LIIELTIDRIVNSASLNGVTYATFDHKFPDGFVVPILKTANSGTIPNVTLTQGIDASLEIIPIGKLDIQSDVYIRYVYCSDFLRGWKLKRVCFLNSAATISGKLGIPITLSGLKQAGVPTQ
jgi:hypothetical protein